MALAGFFHEHIPHETISGESYVLAFPLISKAVAFLLHGLQLSVYQ